MTQIEVTGTAPIALYRLFAADGTLLYVGITGSLGTRFAQHAGDKPWWPLVIRKTISWQDSRAQAESAEQAAIQAEAPVHNILRLRGERDPEERPYLNDRHKVKVITWRPGDADSVRWLRQEAADAGVPVAAVIDRALGELRQRREQEDNEE